MPSPSKGPRLGSGPAHERLMLANLATALFEHDQITTTHAKAKRLRPLAERLITFAKRGDLHSRRRVMTIVRDKGVVHRLFTEIAPDVAARPGGYTRIVKIGTRKGDNAPMAVIELIREPYSPKQATVKEAEAATKRASREGASAAAAAPAAAPVTSPAAEPPAEPAAAAGPAPEPEGAVDSVIGSDAPTNAVGTTEAAEAATADAAAPAETATTDAVTTDTTAAADASDSTSEGAVDTPVAAEAAKEPELAAADEAPPASDRPTKDA